jgi:hypothetical protein
MQHQEKKSTGSDSKKRLNTILKKTGIPPIFAQLLEEKSQTLGSAFAIRADCESENGELGINKRSHCR